MHSPLMSFSPNGKWLVIAGPDNTAVVKRIVFVTYDASSTTPNKLILYIDTHDQGIFDGHQRGLQGQIIGILYEGIWNGDDVITTVSTDGSRMKWDVAHCVLIEELSKIPHDH